jgi:hypothetical protein
LIGKGKNPTGARTGSNGGTGHISRPLATLKDPTSFGPPPKNVNFHGGAALPNEITPDRRRLGAPLSKAQAESAERAVHRLDTVEAEETAKPAGPPVPYRANRTGLNTDHLPPPPIHRTVEGGGGPEHDLGTTIGPSISKPSPPPRLPPRSNTSNLLSPISSSPPPPAYDSVVDKPKRATNTYFKQDAVSRLGKAGISVPGLGIGQSDKTTPKSPTESPSSTQSQLSEVQTRFSRMNKSSTPPLLSSPPAASSQGTTLAQKQAAFKTAQSFQKDPTSVSLTDAQTAANTANNFRERHQEQISAGAQRANTWNKKYNITSRMNSFLEQQSSTPEQPQKQDQQGQAHHQRVSPQTAHLPSPTPILVTAPPDLNQRKAPPPPPPPKKPSSMLRQAAMGSSSSSELAPPPVPLGTKPSFG